MALFKFVTELRPKHIKLGRLNNYFITVTNTSRSIFSMAQQPLLGHGLLIIEVSQSHSDTPQSVVILWMTYQPVEDLCLTKHNTHNRETSVSPAGFEPTTPASEWPQTHALDRAATGIDHQCLTCGKQYKRTVLLKYLVCLKCILASSNCFLP